MSDHNQRRRKTIIKFFFPLYPIKVFRSTKLMFILALLFALRIILQLVSIPIPGFVLSFSVSYTAVMLIGWYFGPVYGLICGAITDTLTYLIFPGGVWYWMYAIQEPIVGMLAGLFASWCAYRKTKDKIKIGVDIAIQQMIFLAFAICSYTVLIMWLSNSATYNTKMYVIYRWIALGLITAFFVLIEVFTFYNVVSNKHNLRRNVTFIYTLILVASCTLLLSFMLGPISSVSYLEYLNSRPPDAWIKFGAVYYLIPRVIVQSIKTPVEALLLTSLVLMLDPTITRVLGNVNNRWENIKA
ncbi:MAG: ECF transporter S component [Mycoplasmataceae bacterium]|nr:ECF transporter S component [Mycoplasmataceae bacterium]